MSFCVCSSRALLALTLTIAGCAAPVGTSEDDKARRAIESYRTVTFVPVPGDSWDPDENAYVDVTATLASSDDEEQLSIETDEVRIEMEPGDRSVVVDVTAGEGWLTEWWAFQLEVMTPSGWKVLNPDGLWRRIVIDRVRGTFTGEIRHDAHAGVDYWRQATFVEKPWLSLTGAFGDDAASLVDPNTFAEIRVLATPAGREGGGGRDLAKGGTASYRHRLYLSREDGPFAEISQSVNRPEYALEQEWTRTAEGVTDGGQLIELSSTIMHDPDRYNRRREAYGTLHVRVDEQEADLEWEINDGEPRFEEFPLPAFVDTPEVHYLASSVIAGTLDQVLRFGRSDAYWSAGEYGSGNDGLRCNARIARVVAITAVWVVLSGAAFFGSAAASGGALVPAVALWMSILGGVWGVGRLDREHTCGGLHYE